MVYLSPNEEETLLCAKCGFKAKSKRSLAMHKVAMRKQGEDHIVKPDEEEVPVTPLEEKEKPAEELKLEPKTPIEKLKEELLRKEREEAKIPLKPKWKPKPEKMLIYGKVLARNAPFAPLRYFTGWDGWILEPSEERELSGLWQDVLEVYWDKIPWAEWIPVIMLVIGIGAISVKKGRAFNEWRAKEKKKKSEPGYGHVADYPR